MVAFGRLETKENCELPSLKVVAVAYERWSLTRGSNYSDLTRKNLVFRKSGRLRKVVARGGSTVLLPSSHNCGHRLNISAYLLLLPVK